MDEQVCLCFSILGKITIAESTLNKPKQVNKTNNEAGRAPLCSEANPIGRALPMALAIRQRPIWSLFVFDETPRKEAQINAMGIVRKRVLAAQSRNTLATSKYEANIPKAVWVLWTEIVFARTKFPGAKSSGSEATEMMNAKEKKYLNDSL